LLLCFNLRSPFVAKDPEKLFVRWNEREQKLGGNDLNRMEMKINLKTKINLVYLIERMEIKSKLDNKINYG
jgi:hypothetical protein